MIRQEYALKTIEDKQKGLLVQDREELCLSVWAREGFDLFFALPAHIGQCSDQKILKRRIRLIKAPPQTAGEGLHFLRGNLLEPFPGERTLAHATNGDKAEQTSTECWRGRIGHPIGQPVEFRLSSDQVAHLRERIGVSNIGRWGCRDRRSAMQLCCGADAGRTGVCCVELFAQCC